MSLLKGMRATLKAKMFSQVWAYEARIVFVERTRGLCLLMV